MIPILPASALALRNLQLLQSKSKFEPKQLWKYDQLSQLIPLGMVLFSDTSASALQIMRTMVASPKPSLFSEVTGIALLNKSGKEFP
jgi:hypothetical protein